MRMGSIMESKIIELQEIIKPVYLHLELRDDYLSDYQKRMLKRHGGSSTGESISRDILVPYDMMLHNLHYAIQKLYGWTNSHLRKFSLPEEIHEELTKGTVRGWFDLVGVLFQPPSEGQVDIFWDDDYNGGSFNSWLKKKYTGPYYYRGTMEHRAVAKQDVQDMLDRFPLIEVRESFQQYMSRSSLDQNEEVKILRKAPLISLTLKEMDASLSFDGGDTECLLERLKVDQVLIAQSDEVNSQVLFPVTKELIYTYDFGDDWVVTITKHKDCRELLNQNLIGIHELEEAKEVVLTKHKPVCIHKDGVSVLDDVGGLGGFADLLSVLYEETDQTEKANARAWAKSQGWSDKKVLSKKML